MSHAPPSLRASKRSRKNLRIMLLLASGTPTGAPRSVSRGSPHPGCPESRRDQLPGSPLGYHLRRNQTGDHCPTARRMTQGVLSRCTKRSTKADFSDLPAGHNTWRNADRQKYPKEYLTNDHYRHNFLIQGLFTTPYDPNRR